MLLSGASLITMESCKKSNYYDAIVIADGDAAIDGCGWLLNIGGVVYYPIGLRDGDKVNGKTISIQFTVSALPFKCVNNLEYPVASITRFL